MSAALDFRKCKRLLLSSLAVSALYRGPRGILCTRGEKEYASIRQPTAACDNRLVKREAYDASPGRAPYKSDDTMFLPLAKEMCLRRDADSREGSPPPYTKNNRKSGCFLSMTNKKERLFKPKRVQASTGS